MLVLGDDPLARSAVIAALEREGAELRVHGQEPSPADPLPHVIVYDTGLSGRLPGPLRDRVAAEPPVLALAADEVAAWDAIEAGASGAVSRQASPSHLVAAVRAVAEGLVVIDRSFLGPAVAKSSAAELEGPREPLTAREREVLTLLVEGLSNRAIAERLGISEHTAKFHVNTILGKLGVQKRLEAVVRAARLGIVEL